MRLNHLALVSHQSGFIQMSLKSPEELFDLSSSDQHFSKQPDRFLVWNGIGQRQPQKLLEREPVVDLVLRLLIREIVVSRQHEHLDHHHHIMAGAAAGPPGLLLARSRSFRNIFQSILALSLVSGSEPRSSFFMRLS